jgi:tetratricopeptide (TPR) repeat protein
MLGEAHASLGRQQYAGGIWDWEGAERHLRRALELSPGYAAAHMWYAEILMKTGRVAEGSAEIQRALELDPFSPVVLWSAGRFASWAGDHERGIELGKRAVDLSPEFLTARVNLSDSYTAAGRENEAAEILLAALPPAAQGELRSAYAAGGPKALLERFLQFEQERTGKPCGFRSSVGVSLFAQLGDSDGVFRCLQEGARTGESASLSNPLFAPYRSDPRWAAYLEAINLRE